MTEYARALGRLAALARFGMRPGLEAIERVLGELGHPERRVAAVQVAGTNGKGSTAAFAESILSVGGVRTGLYTSPHLSRFTERIKVAGREIERGRAAALVERVLAAPGGDSLTFFEVATAMAFLQFAEEGVEVAVIEVGLGGRLDATSACAPVASVVTAIGLDHVEELGPTVGAIAREKVGIARAGVPLVVGEMDVEAGEVIAARAAEVGAPMIREGRDFSWGLAGGRFDYQGPGGGIEGVELGLAGAHQGRNAALALAAIGVTNRFSVSEQNRREGLAGVRWPGRLERIGEVILDGAHNPHAARALAEALPGVTGGRPFTLVIGLLADKDAGGVLEALVPLAARVVCTRPASPRALGPEELARRVRAITPGIEVEVVEGPEEAVGRVRGLAVVCGSLYLVGAVRRAITGEEGDPVAVSDPIGRG